MASTDGSSSSIPAAGVYALAAVAGAAVGAAVAVRFASARDAPATGSSSAGKPAGDASAASPKRETQYAYAVMNDATPLAARSPARGPSRAAVLPPSASIGSLEEACLRVASASSSDMAMTQALLQAPLGAAGPEGAAGGVAAPPVLATVPGLVAPAAATKAVASPFAGPPRRSPSFAGPVTRPVILGVGGASGSGKTSMNRILSRSLPGLRVASISGDSYYIPLPPGTDASDYNFDKPSAIDFDLLASHLAELRAGKAIEVPRYDFATHSRLETTEHVGNVHVIIVDGIFTLTMPAIRDLCDFTVFTLEDLDVCLARRLRRDIAQRGRSVDDVLEQYERFVKPGYHLYVAPTMRYANLIVPRVRDNTETLVMLVEYLRNRVAVFNPEVKDDSLRVGDPSVDGDGRRPSLFEPDP